MEQEKVSVIVPIYNTKKDLFEACLSSIIHQTYQNIEILLIDDGSQLRCAQMVDELATQDPRIKVAHRANGGVSIARNFGMAWAEGEWIAFVDSDDIVAPWMLEHAVQIAKEYHVEFVLGMAKIVDGPTEWEASSLQTSAVRVYRERDFGELRSWYLSCSTPKGLFVPQAPYAKLISSKLAKQCTFLETCQLGEDRLWNLSFLEKISCAVVVSEQWYQYIQCNTSIMHRYDERCVQWIVARQKLLEREIIAAHPELKVANQIYLLRELAYQVIKGTLLHPDCPMSWREKKTYLQKILRQYPYEFMRDCRIRANKDGVKLLLLRANLILEAYWLKTHLMKEK